MHQEARPEQRQDGMRRSNVDEVGGDLREAEEAGQRRRRRRSNLLILLLLGFLLPLLTRDETQGVDDSLETARFVHLKDVDEQVGDLIGQEGRG